MTRMLQLISRLEFVVNFESAMIVSILLALAQGIHLTLLKEVSKERHQTMRRHYWRGIASGGASLVGIGLFLLVQNIPASWPIFNHLLVSVGMVAFILLFVWSYFVVRFLVFVGAFLMRPRVPVPLLLINVVSVVIGMAMVIIAAAEFLGLSLAPLLATSAIASVILGLALQETLGNLFSGIALQFDRPFRIDDWVEITHAGGRVVGMVKEISWRATVFQSLTDEWVIIPNRIISGAQVANFTDQGLNLCRSQVFNLPFGADFEQVEKAILGAIASVEELLKEPPPKLYLARNSDSFIETKLIYYVKDYGAAFRVGDRILRDSHAALRRLNLPIGTPRIIVEKN